MKQTRTPETEFVEIINKMYVLSVDNIIDIGRRLLEARQAYPKTFYSDIAKNLVFGRNACARYIRIASNSALSNPRNAKRLPSSKSTLYELSKFPPSVIDTYISKRMIDPTMKLKDAKALLKLPQVKFALIFTNVINYVRYEDPFISMRFINEKEIHPTVDELQKLSQYVLKLSELIELEEHALNKSLTKEERDSGYFHNKRSFGGKSVEQLYKKLE